MLYRTEIEPWLTESKTYSFNCIVLLLRSLSQNPQPDSVRKVEVLVADPATLIIRWSAVWMPTRAVTVLLCAYSDHGRRSLKTYPTWCVSC